MRFRWRTFAWFALASSFAASAQTLHVYGPGGPYAPMHECADVFAAKSHIPVVVTAGPEKNWMPEAEANADVIYGGAEYMLTQFDLQHPGFLLPGSRVELYSRAAGILVRKGNPKNIESLADLTKPGVRIVDVSGAGQQGLWEDLAGRPGLIDGIERNIALAVPNSAEAIRQWSARPELDAWISFESWHYRLADSTTLVRLPEAQRLYRGTPAAIAARTQHREQAEEFLHELQSPACHAVFQRWGWK